MTVQEVDNFWLDITTIKPDAQARVLLMIIVQGDLRVAVGHRDAQLDCYITHIGSFRPSAVRYWAEIPKLV